MNPLNNPAKYLQAKGRLPAGAIPLAEEQGLICWSPQGWVKTWTLQPIKNLPPDTIKPVMAIISDQIGTSSSIATAISDEHKTYSPRSIDQWRCGVRQFGAIAAHRLLQALAKIKD